MTLNEGHSRMERRSHRHTQKLPKPPRRNKKRLVMIILSLLLACGLIYGVGRFLNNIFHFTDSIYQAVDRQKMRKEAISLKKEDPVSILVAGVDNGALMYKNIEEGRTDVMMVVTINPKENKSTILSIPRDTLAPQGTSNKFDKLNHAYMDGGIKDTINSVQRLLDIPIDHYVEVNMKAFIDIIDSLDGIDVVPPMTFEQDGAFFTKGQTMHINGEQAMQYVRMREKDPQGDIGRQKRQQQVVQAVIDKFLSVDTAFNYEEILEKLGQSLKTDLRARDMMDLQKNYLKAVKKPVHLVFEDWVDLKLPFGWYLMLKEADRIKMSNQIRELLGLEPTQSAIVYPIEFGVIPDYFPVEDTNKNGILDSGDMLIDPGIYQRKDLDALIRKFFGEDGLMYEKTHEPSQQISRAIQANNGLPDVSSEERANIASPQQKPRPAAAPPVSAPQSTVESRPAAAPEVPSEVQPPQSAVSLSVKPQAVVQ